MFFTQLEIGDPGSSWIPLVDGVMKVVWVNVVPEAIRGFVAMAAALAITFLAFKEAEQSAVRYSVLTVYVVPASLLLLFNLFHVGFNRDTFGMIGLMAGFFAAALYSTDQRPEGSSSPKEAFSGSLLAEAGDQGDAKG